MGTDAVAPRTVSIDETINPGLAITPDLASLRI